MARNNDGSRNLSKNNDKLNQNKDSELRRPPVPKPALKNQNYGIDQAIELMKRLPEADMRVLATVIKETLESVNIKVSTIIKDAESKEIRLEEQIKKLDKEIEDLESMIAQRKKSIHEFLSSLEETRQVKNNLALASGSTGADRDLHVHLRSKAATEYTALREQQSLENKAESLEKSQEPADKAVLLDALFSDTGDS